MPKLTPLPWLTFALAFAFCQPGTADAQTVTWRQDYSAARKEATETGKPILLDFGTEACVWCRKLDATTFRDPKIAKLLNERFIPVKIDAEREPRLTRALAIDSFPTLVLASADGKELGRQVGYADVSQMSTLLGKAPTRQDSPPQPPKRETAASQMLSLAKKDFDNGRYADCLRQCNQILLTQSTALEVQESRKLVQRIVSDPNATRLVKEQIDAGLATIQLQLASALEH